MTMKKKGDKGVSKLNTSEAKAMWTEVCMRTPHSTKEFLMEEKGFSGALVEAVMAEPRSTAVVQEPVVNQAQSEGQQDLPVQLTGVQAEASTPNRDDNNDIQGGVSL